MRILTVTHFYEAHGGGIERVAGHLCREFAKLGQSPVWAASDEDPSPSSTEPVPLACFNGIERLSGLPLPIPGLSAVRRLWQAVKNADAVLIHNSLYLTSIVALVAARRAKKPVILIQHVADIPFSSIVLRRLMQISNWLVTRNMIRAADQIVFISETTRGAFQDVATRREPLTLFNGVDGTIFWRGLAGEATAARRELDLSAGRRVLLFVGRFVEKKGLTVIEALARRRPDLQFVLAGHGVIDPASWGLANVNVLRGRSGESLALAYRAADMLLLPSVGEGYPLVIQEAMACGLPVICGRDTARADPGAGRWLIGVDIELAKPGDTAARIAEVIDTSAADESASTEMAHYAKENYSWERMARRLTSVFAEMQKI